MYAEFSSVQRVERSIDVLELYPKHQSTLAWTNWQGFLLFFNIIMTIPDLIEMTLIVDNGVIYLNKYTKFKQLYIKRYLFNV